jgi:hypothetical protein
MNPKELQRQSKVVWFEIPATDFNRATRFYEQIFATSLRVGDMEPQKLAVFPYEAPAISGCVIAGQGYVPGGAGGVIYLNADPTLSSVVDRVAAAGGKVLVPRVELPEGMGVFAHILDTEGNRIGLHANA